MITILLAVAFVAFVVIVNIILMWKPEAGNGFDFCEVCGRPATHELGGSITLEADGGSGMIASYCRKDAPSGAVKVR